MKSLPTKTVVVQFVLALSADRAAACSTSLTVQLETFGEGVTIELWQSAPGNSKMVQSSTSSGGTVYFVGLCAGSGFMAIGDGETVSVSPGRQ